MAISDSGLGVEFASTDEFYTYILNDLFLPAVADTVINPNFLLSRIGRDSTRVEGKDVVFPVHTGRNTGVNAIAPGGQLPDPGAQAYDRYNFSVRHIYGRVKFDGVSVDASKSQMASWLKVIESEIQGLATDMARQRQRMYHGDGSGAIAQLADNPGTGGTEAINLAKFTGVEGNADDYTLTKHVKVGDYVAFVNPADGTVRDSKATAVLSITDSDTFTANMASMGAATTGDAIVFSSMNTTNSSAINTSWLNEPMGLAGIFSDGGQYHDKASPTAVAANSPATFQGLNPAAAGNDWHQANLLSNSGTQRSLTLSLMDQAYQKSMEVGDVVPTMILGSYGMFRTYADLMLTDRRYVDTKTFDGGYEALEYNGCPVAPDRDCYTNRFYFIYEPDLKIYVMSDPGWMDMDGSIYHRLPDHDSYQATMYCRETLGTDVRDRQTALLDINEL